MPEIRVILEDGGKELQISLSPVYRDRALSVLLGRSGFVLNTRCGQKGLCRGCEVIRENGTAVKACQYPASVFAGESVLIPSRSLIQGSLSVAVDFQPRCGFSLQPVFEPDEGKPYALCIDVGTTTVVLLLVDMRNGSIVDRASGYNAQVRMGEDVLTRIDACRQSVDQVREGQRLLVGETLSPLWREVSERSGVSGKELGGAVVAANTTMLHFLVGEDPGPMGRVPFTPTFLEQKRLQHSDFPWPEDLWASGTSFEWILLPGYAAYVGADIASGWLASGMAESNATTLLIDIGTNGEILLQHEGRLTGCATAAGPAFEGAQLSWGTRAISGAVSRLSGDLLKPDTLQTEVVGRKQARAAGFCGSAYIDFLFHGLACGLLKGSGRFDTEKAEAAGLPPGAGKYGRCWYLDPSDREGPSISEADIALLLQAKAAIAAGTQVLLKRCGLQPGQVDRVYLAGGFGLNLGIASAIGCGLLYGFREEQIEVVGNAALGGAYVSLLDRDRCELLNRSTHGVEIIELNEDPDFEDTYIDHLRL